MGSAALQFGQAITTLAAVGLGGLLIAHVLIAVLALVGILRSEQPVGGKLMWSAAAAALPLVGSAAWFLVGRHPHRAQWQQA